MRVKIFRKNDDLRQLVDHQRRRRALASIVTPVPHPAEPVMPAPAESRLAPVVSLAAARARRVGHPSAIGRTEVPVTARH